MKRETKLLLLFATLFFVQIAAFSQGVFRSRASGNWSASTTWTLLSGTDADGIPDADDNVTITDFDVTVGSTVSCNNLIIDGNVNKDTSFLLVAAAGTVNVLGNFSIDGSPPKKAAGLDVKGTIRFARLVEFGNSNTVYYFASTSVIEFNGAAQAIPALRGSALYANLVLSGSGVKTIANKAGVTTSFALRGTATVAGSALKYNTGATITYGGTIAQTTSNIEFPATAEPASVIINNPAGVTLHAARNIQHLTLTNGILNIGTFTLGVTGNITRSTGTVNLVNAVLNLNGTSGQVIAAGAVTGGKAKDITIANTSTTGVTINDNLSVSGTLQVNAGAILRPGATSVFSGTGLVTGSGTIQVTRAGGVNNLSAQYALNRTITNLTVEYAGTARQSADAIAYPRLSIRNTSDVDLNGNTSVTALTLASGCLRIGTNTLTINGAVARIAGFLAGSHVSNLTIGAVAGTLFFAQNGSDNFLKNFTLNSAARATLGNPLNITGGTAFNAEGMLTVVGTGVLTTGGLLTIKSNQFGTGSIAAGNTAGGYIVGNVTVERFIPQNTSKSWRLLASNTSGQTIHQAWQEGQAPLANSTPGFGTMIPGTGSSLAAVQALGFDSLSAGASLYRYNTLTESLEAVPNTNATALSSSQGYFVFIRGNRAPGQMGAAAGNTPVTATTLRSTGAIFQGNQPTVSVPANKQVLVRNPYPSAIDLNKAVLTGGLVRAFKVWDPKLNGAFGTGAYQTFTKVGSNFLVTPGGGSFGASGTVNNIVESGAAFFVQAVGSAGTITINEDCKVAGSRLAFRPADNAADNKLLITNLYVVRNNIADLVDGNMIVFDDDVSNAVDMEDVKKSSNFGENIGIFKDSTNLVVEKRPSLLENDTLNYRLAKLKRSDYKLEILPMNLANPALTAILVDKYRATSTPLTLTDTNWYSFTVDANVASAAADRFSVVFRNTAPLPVRFIAVSVAAKAQSVSVKWLVGNEINITKYQVQQSSNGSDFVTVGTTDASAINEYTFTTPAPNGASFYRIVAVDANGQFTYSTIVKLTRSQVVAPVQILPNPVTNGQAVVKFTASKAGVYQLAVVDAAGRTLYATTGKAVAGLNQQAFQLPKQAAAGVYQLRIYNLTEEPMTQKLMLSANN